MIKRKLFKPWKETRAEIENAIDNYSDVAENDLTLANGIQHKCTITHNSNPISSVVHRTSKKAHVEFYAINYMSPESGESFFSQWRYDSLSGVCKLTKKVPVRQCLKILVYIPNQHAFVGYCSDMTLRGYNGTTFEEKSRLAVHSSVLSMLYIDEFDELITAGQGYVFSWHLKMIEYGFLVDPKNPPFFTEINSSREWVTRLFYDEGSKTIMALTDDVVYIISIVTRQQIEVFYNSHRSSLSYCTFYQPLQYFITAARDGTVHIYHTGLQNNVRSFSAHLDGVTGVACLAKQPILITWSQKCGSMRMWRLDTGEMTNETILTENINRLSLPNDDRLFYLGDTNVQIFAVNILYDIFNSLSSAIESMKLCNVRRAIKSDAKIKRDFTEKHRTTNSTNSLSNNALKSEKSNSRARERWFNILNKLEVGANPEEHFVKLMQDESLGVDKTSYLDERLVCVLDDFSIVEVSPLTGLLLNITYPTAEIDQKHLSIDIDRKGGSCFVALQTGSYVEVDIKAKPGLVTKAREPLKDDQKVLSVAAVEMYVDEGQHRGLRLQTMLIGLENGCVALSDDSIENRRISSRKSSIAALMKRKSSLKDSAGGGNAEPVVMMSPIQAHQGRVLMIFAPPDGSVTVNHENYLSAKIYNVFLTYGDDGKIVVWRGAIVPGALPNRFEILLNKLQYLGLNHYPICMAITSNVILFGFGRGQVEMYGFNWKYYVSGNGAIIRIECNMIVLPGFKKIVVDQEFHHKQAVTCAHASQILNLFVTTSEDALIKIWDTDGLLVRELVLGDVIPSVCFAYGRNLVATLRNHIILIEAATYLPAEYLQKLLKYADEANMSDPEPEKPMPLKSGEGSSSAASRKSKESEVSQVERHSSVETTSKADMQNVQDDMKNINHLLRYLRRKRSFFTQALEAVQKHENQFVEEVKINYAQYTHFKGTLNVNLTHRLAVEVFSGIHLKEFMPIVRVQDLAENFLSKIEKDRMKKRIMAPDGAIPNSVVRIHFTPVMAAELVRSFVDERKSQHSKMLLLELIRRERMARRHSYDEVFWVDSDESSFGDLVERTSSLHRSQVLELSDRSKWEMKDELNEKKIVRRFGSKTHVKPKKHPTVESIKTFQSQKPAVVARTASEEETQGQSSRLKKLLALLQDLQKQRWCSHIITPDTFEEGLSAIAEILQHAGSRICLEICKALEPIVDACQELKPEDEYHNLFSLLLQRKYVVRLGELLFSPINLLQRTAANILAKFDDDLLLNIILSNLMPKFLETSGTKKILQSNEMILAEAARLVKYLSFHIDTGRLYTLSRLAKVDDYRDEVTDEQMAVLEGISNALNVAGVDSIDLVVWACFAFPLLSKRKISIPPINPPPTEAETQAEKKEETRTESAVISVEIRTRRKSVSTKGGKTKGSKPAKKGQQVDSIQVDSAKKRKVSFDDKAQIVPAEAKPAVVVSPETKVKKPSKSILSEVSTPPKHESKTEVKLEGSASSLKVVESGEAQVEAEATGDGLLEERRASLSSTRPSSADILRRSSRDLKQYPELWVEDAPTDSTFDSSLAGLTANRLGSKADVILKNSSEFLQLSEKYSKRHSIGSERDLYQNEQICILKSKRRLSLQRSSTIQAGKRLFAHFTGISADSRRRSSLRDRAKMASKTAESHAEDEYESFLPTVIEASDAELEAQKEGPSGSAEGDTALPRDSSFLPPPPAASLCDDVEDEHVTDESNIEEFEGGRVLEIQSQIVSEEIKPIVKFGEDLKLDTSRIKSSKSWPGSFVKSRPDSSKSWPRLSRAHPEAVKARMESLVKPVTKLPSKPDSTLLFLPPHARKTSSDYSKSMPDSTKVQPPELSKSKLKPVPPKPLSKLASTRGEGAKPAVPIGDVIAKVEEEYFQSGSAHKLPALITHLEETKPVRPPSRVRSLSREKRRLRRSFSSDLSRLKSEVARMSDELEGPESWRHVLQTLKYIRLKKEEQKRTLEQYKQAASNLSPPSPVCSPYPDLKSKGDFIEPLIDERKRVRGTEFKKKVENLQLLTTQSYEKNSRAVAMRNKKKIRSVLDKVIFTPNRTMNYSMQNLRKKLNFFVNRKKNEKLDKLNKLFLACGDQVKPKDKVFYRWSISSSFTLHSELSFKMSAL